MRKGVHRVREFTLNGVELHIPEECLTAPLAEAIEQGRYEHNEAAALRRHLQPGDRVLDLGAGAGYLSSLAAGVVGGENVVAVEAGPQMIAALRGNLVRNDASEATVVHGAVVADSHGGDTVDFLSRRAFWASAVTREKAADNARIMPVPALGIGGLLAVHQPTVVILDIEGGEADLCDTVWPETVRLLVLEIHTKLYSGQVLQQIFDGLSRSGLTYMPWGSRGETVVFQRVSGPADQADNG